MTAPLSDTHLTLRTEILAALSAAGAFCGECGFEPGETGCADCVRVRGLYADAVMPIVDRLRAELARERAERDRAVDRSLQRLSRGIDVTLARKEAERQRDEARAELAAAKDRIHAVETVRCWTNEDGRRFVFAEDLAAALGYTPTNAAPTEAVRCVEPGCPKVAAPLGWARNPWRCPDHVVVPTV